MHAASTGNGSERRNELGKWEWEGTVPAGRENPVQKGRTWKDAAFYTRTTGCCNSDLTTASNGRPWENSADRGR